MLYFREKEQQRLFRFFDSASMKAMAIYGRRRTGKTELILDSIKKRTPGEILYFQCPGTDYETCVSDFATTLRSFYPDEELLSSLKNFKDLFVYISRLEKHIPIIVIDEFPFLAKKHPDVVAEFQWIIDHGLRNSKIILLGSNRSFMKHQIQNNEYPLYYKNVGHS